MVTVTDDNAVSQDLDAISSAVSALRSDATQAGSDQASLPTYVPAGLPTPTEIRAAMSSGSSSAASARAKTKVYLATMKQLDLKSDVYAKLADDTCNRVSG